MQTESIPSLFICVGTMNSSTLHHSIPAVERFISRLIDQKTPPALNQSVGSARGGTIIFHLNI